MSRSIVTRHGDSGQTKLIYGESISKAQLQVETYGTLDEWNAFLGMARAQCETQSIKDVLEQMQRDTFILGAELATPIEHLDKLKTRVSPAMVQVLDGHIARLEELPNLLDDWALPGATIAGAAIDVARVVCRRAERLAVRLSDEGLVPNEDVLRYLNRASDLLWLLGRQYEIEHHANGALRIETV